MTLGCFGLDPLSEPLEDSLFQLSHCGRLQVLLLYDRVNLVFEEVLAVEDVGLLNLVEVVRATFLRLEDEMLEQRGAGLSEASVRACLVGFKADVAHPLPVVLREE